MEKIKVCIVGAGNICTGAHLPAYAKRKDVEIVAICDLNEERAKTVAGEWKIPQVFTDVNEMLDRVKADYMDCCVWTGSHAECVIAAAKHGVPILSEKPTALNLEQALAMEKAVDEAGVPFMLAVPTRYTAESMALREMVDEGKLGDIYYAKTAYVRRRGTPTGWFTDSSRAGGGPVIDIGVHCIDRTWFLMGNPRPTRVSASVSYAIGAYTTKGVSSWGGHDGSGVHDTEDSACGIIHFENGAAMLFEVSWAINGPETNYTQICGSKAGATQDPLTIYGETDGYLSDNKINPGRNDMFYEEIDHFIECLREGKKPCSDIHQAVQMQRILDGIYKSAKLGKEVEI